MGNCCATSSNTDFQRDYNMSPENHKFLNQEQEQEDEEEEDENSYHYDDHVSETTSSTRSNSPFLATPLNDITTTTTTTATTMVLPLVDPRLVSLLDFFRHLRSRRNDIFNKIMPAHRHDFESIFNEMKKVQQLEKTDSKMGGVIRQRSLSVGDENGLRLERFKVKPIDSGGVKQPPNGGKGGGGLKPADSNK